jgi:hypothetical protein
MSCSFHWSGLDELREALRHLPEELTAEAGHIVEAATNAAETTIKGGYPPGELQDSVYSVVNLDGFHVIGVVRVTSPIAWIFENGTQARHTELGLDRGSMPPAHVFIPAMIAGRLWMYPQLKELLERNGLVVSGEAED